jgi:hypothetical protein
VVTQVDGAAAEPVLLGQGQVQISRAMRTSFSLVFPFRPRSRGKISGPAARMLILFAPSLPHEEYFTELADIRSEDPETARIRSALVAGVSAETSGAVNWPGRRVGGRGGP